MRPYTSNYNHTGKKLMHHAIWWVLFIIYELSLYFFATGKIASPGKQGLFYTINMLLFYFHQYILEKNLGSAKKRYLQMVLFGVVNLLIFLGVKVSFDLYFMHIAHQRINGWATVKSLAAIDAYRCVFFLGLSSLYWTASHLSDYEKRVKEAEINRLKADANLADSENALLRQQINPHLMFNSLNFIYSTVHKVSEKAANHIILLTDILRFAHEKGGDDGKVPLRDEIEQVHNLIYINEARFDHIYPVYFKITEPLYDQRIIPLVLMTLVENVFKHGDLTQQEAYVTLEFVNGTLIFKTRNKIKASVPYPRLKSTGLANMRIRLDFAYGKDFHFENKVNGSMYETELRINI